MATDNSSITMKDIAEGLLLRLTKAVQDIQDNQAKEDAGHLQLAKNDDNVHDPAAVDASIRRYHAAAQAYKATKPIRSAAVTSIKQNTPPKKIPSLAKPIAKEEIGGDLNKEEKQSKQRIQSKDPAAVALGRKGGLKGGPARMNHISHAQAEAIARKGADARWGGTKDFGPIKDQQINDSKDKIKKEELDPSEHPVDNFGTVVDKPRDGATLPPKDGKRIPRIPAPGSGGEKTLAKDLDKGAIADAVNAAKAKGKAQGISDERLKDVGFPGTVKKSTIPSAPTAPKPKAVATTPASSSPPPAATPKTPKAL